MANESMLQTLQLSNEQTKPRFGMESEILRTIIPEIGNTPVLVGGSSKKFPINFFANSCFFCSKKGVTS